MSESQISLCGGVVGQTRKRAISAGVIFLTTVPRPGKLGCLGSQREIAESAKRRHQLRHQQSPGKRSVEGVRHCPHSGVKTKHEKDESEIGAPCALAERLTICQLPFPAAERPDHPGCCIKYVPLAVSWVRTIGAI
jgi:hypothetical protein